VLLVLGLVRSNVWGWASSSTVTVFVCAAILLAAFGVIQVRKDNPLVPQRLVRTSTVRAADLGMLLAGAAIFAVFFFLTLYMQTVLHYSALKTGLAYLPISGMITIGAGVAAKVLSKVGSRVLLVAGFTSGAIGLALLVRISPTGDYPGAVLPSILLIGAGLGTVFVTLTSTAVHGVDGSDAGIASALLNASQQIGGSLGLAVLTTVATSRFNAIHPRPTSPLAQAGAFTNSCAWAFAVAAGLLVIAALLSVLLMPTTRTASSRSQGHSVTGNGMHPARTETKRHVIIREAKR
jgi:predicted MFS family arabinose efflux permease